MLAMDALGLPTYFKDNRQRTTVNGLFFKDNRLRSTDNSLFLFNVYFLRTTDNGQRSTVFSLRTTDKGQRSFFYRLQVDVVVWRSAAKPKFCCPLSIVSVALRSPGVAFNFLFFENVIFLLKSKNYLLTLYFICQFFFCG